MRWATHTYETQRENFCESTQTVGDTDPSTMGSLHCWQNIMSFLCSDERMNCFRDWWRSKMRILISEIPEGADLKYIVDCIHRITSNDVTVEQIPE